MNDRVLPDDKSEWTDDDEIRHHLDELSENGLAVRSTGCPICREAIRRGIEVA